MADSNDTDNRQQTPDVIYTDEEKALLPDYRAAAKATSHRDGEIEIDEEATVSFGDDSGAYVQAWVWVECDMEEDDGGE